ncbi:DUF4400 domain-containing protein [Photorhabdus caribbeanensis]|uniref:DUF4400 domain-containing protein n=1 Tax=Photorhabdus caribbeanensis TaxID=1004165 RepID=UPI001BD32048|nr:DUF4400 domain-containing protein [Photorhabdus caribbeanensis]MBS9424197.1 DUF4400 domain-containing protein [Photorhabdus caribbeanensis]
MKKPWLLVVWLLTIELLVILLLIPGNWIDRSIKQESVLVEQNLGIEARDWIQEKASTWLRDSIIDSGFYEGMYYMLIPSEKERQKSSGMENMGQDWFVWVKGRMEALVNVIYQFYTRLALLMAWAPYMLILFLPAIYDGMMTWKIKRTNFDYASPVIHRYSVRGTLYLMAGLFITFFVPVALNPVIIPITMMACCVLVGLTFGNLQKRV